jgi:hypothetical protein
MLHQSPSITCLSGIVEVAVTINTIVTVFENGMTKHVGWLAVTMLPNERNLLGILMLESIWHDGSPVHTHESSFCGIAAKVGLSLFSHFECSSLIK